MKWNSVQAAVCRNKRQNLLQTSKFVPGISRSKSTWNFEVPVVDQLTEINIDHRISYIQFFRIFHHVSIDLKSLLEMDFGKRYRYLASAPGLEINLRVLI